MKDSKVLWAWIGGVVIVVALIVGVVWYFYANTPKKVVIGPVAVHAPVGQLIAGFPKELILDNAAAVSNSYSINYSTSTNQYTVEWSSSSTIAALYAKYQAYAQANGWTITNHADTAPFKGISATNASSTATMSVILIPQGKGSKVTISYIAQ
jgi:hypothetical protein